MGRIQKIQSFQTMTGTFGYFRIIGIVGAACILAGCAQTYAKREVNYKSVTVERAAIEIPDDQLLDIRIKSFDPGDIPEGEDEGRGISKESRQAEGYYMAVQLRNILQQSGFWGAVRVVPTSEAGTELLVEGSIIESDGESVKLEVTVSDSRGVQWLTKEYEGVVDTSIYKEIEQKRTEPFLFVYTDIANDIAMHRAKIAGKALRSIRAVAELRFAADFAPDVFGGHLEKTDKPPDTANKRPDGQTDFFADLLKKITTQIDDTTETEAAPEFYRIVRLPSEDDPMMRRVRRVRVRENQVVDAIDQQYDGLAVRIQTPYTEWRRSRLSEINAIRSLESKRNEQVQKAVVIGILGVVAGAVLGSQCQNCASAGGALAGAAVGAAVQLALKASDQASEDAAIHKSALEELGQSLAADVEPVIVEVEGKTVQLKGTAEAKFKQWRRIVKKLYEREVEPAIAVLDPPDKMTAVTK